MCSVHNREKPPVGDANGARCNFFVVTARKLEEGCAVGTVKGRFRFVLEINAPGNLFVLCHTNRHRLCVSCCLAPFHVHLVVEQLNCMSIYFYVG